MWTLAINNNRMYYTNRVLAGDLGIGGGHGSVIDGLFRISREVASSIGQDVSPGVQFGSESADIIGDKSLLDRVRRASMRAGGPAIIHHPDDSRPSQTGFIPRLQLDLQAAGYLDSNFVVVHPPAETTPMASRLVSSDLTDRVTVNSVMRSGVGIALENLGPARHQPVLGDVREVASVVRAIRREYGELYGPELSNRVGMCLDYGHHIAFCAREGRDPAEALELLGEDGDLVVMMHIHLNDGSADQHLLPGERVGSSKDDILAGYENVLLEEVIPGFTGCRTYIIERNSPFRMEDLLFAARLIADSVPKNHREV